MPDPDPSFIGGTAQGLLAFLLDIIKREFSLLAHVLEDIEGIKSQLKIAQSFLAADHAEGDEGNSASAAWKAEVRDVAQEAEDIIDLFLYYIAEASQKPKNGLTRAFHSVKTISTRHEIATSVGKIRAKFEDLAKNAVQYGLPAFDERHRAIREQRVRDRRRFEAQNPFFLNNNRVVGLGDQLGDLLTLVKDANHSQRMVIAVKGMGGVGKTTLVGKAYHQAKDSFECAAWATVSQSYNVHEVLHILIRQLMGPEADVVKMQITDCSILIGELQKFLCEKSYLIILDDLWDRDAWRHISSALPENSRGSRALVTTRKYEVISSLDWEGTRVLRLKPLSSCHSWELFCMVAFRNSDSGTCPSHLKKTAEAIVGKCGGLPLAIVAMAGLLASRIGSRLEYWKRVESNLGWHLKNIQELEMVKGVLLLGFNELPYRLKHCFLYFSMFPEDYLIKKNRLIRLWVAEGFVKELHGGGTMEEHAEAYLEELVQRNMIQIASNKSPHKRTKYFKIHDVMRELALMISLEEKFLVVHDGKEAGVCCRGRRLSIQSSCTSINSCTGKLNIRSVFNFDSCCQMLDVFSPLGRIWSHFRLIRVLDLEGAPIEKVPDILFQLFNLRYLNLRKTRITELPKSFNKLGNLETLDIRQTGIKELQCGVSKLQKLRHLTAGPSVASEQSISIIHGMAAPKGVWELTNIQTLAHVKADEKVISNLGNLTQLRKLGMTDISKSHSEQLCSSVSKMRNLRELSIMAVDQLNLEPLSEPPLCLYKLTLVGNLKSLPKWVGSLVNLCYLRLCSSGLNKHALGTLFLLPQLEELELRNAYVSQSMLFPSESFPKLRKLHLWDLENLKLISIEMGALPDMREIQVVHCNRLRGQINGVERLPRGCNLFVG